MIIAVGGGKGGVGKSTVAFNLARELEAVLVEGDLTAGDLPQETGPILADVLAGWLSPTEALQEVGGVSVLSAGTGLTDARASKLTEFESVVNHLDRRRGDVVIDCPPGSAKDVGVQTASADITILVTTPHEAALRDCNRSRELATELGTPVGCVVINEVYGQTRSGTVERVEQDSEPAPVVLPRQEVIGASIDQGRPVRELTDTPSDNDPFEQLAENVRDYESRIG